MVYIFWYFWVIGVVFHCWLAYKLIKPELYKMTRYEPKQPKWSNPRPCQSVGCAACGSRFWTELDSEVYLCPQCIKNGVDIGM